uniref:Uncharacterized protein n=1 Tax=Macaca fascicularis TaxID=9541 RepID=A0A7N9D3W2_MACFA
MAWAGVGSLDLTGVRLWVPASPAPSDPASSLHSSGLSWVLSQPSGILPTSLQGVPAPGSACPAALPGQ